MSDNPIDDVVQIPDALTLDRVLRNAPSEVSEADWDALIPALRADRARFLVSDERKRAKRAGELVDEKEPDDADTPADE